MVASPLPSALAVAPTTPAPCCRCRLACLPLFMHRAVLLKMEEEWVQKTCDQIAAFKPDVVITGVCACVCVWGGW